MPSADVVVIGAGLAGLTAALAVAESGARVQVLAKGHAATHWGPGGLDVAGLPGTASPREGLRILGGRPGHAYAFLADDVEPALAWLRGHLAAEGLVYEGDLDTPLRRVPTAIGGTRFAAILPAGQAAALRPWAPDETLVVCGVAGFKDFWPDAIAASLVRPRVWDETAAPATVEAVTVELPGLAGRHNLNATELARRFDDRTWRAAAIDRIVAGLGRWSGRTGRVALPAILGLQDHPAVLDELRRRSPLEPFEVPLVPPSVPGMRLYAALRARIIAAGGRIRVGEMIAGTEKDGDRVTGIISEAAARSVTVRADAVILATGGIAGGGLVATLDGRLEESVLGLPVEAPPADDWLAPDPFDPAGHPLEGAGVRTDSHLCPVDASGATVYSNVRVAGSLLAGQRYLRERCGDGIALASGWRAAHDLAATAVAAGSASGSERP